MERVRNKNSNTFLRGDPHPVFTYWNELNFFSGTIPEFRKKLISRRFWIVARLKTFASRLYRLPQRRPSINWRVLYVFAYLHSPTLTPLRNKNKKLPQFDWENLITSLCRGKKGTIFGKSTNHSRFRCIPNESFKTASPPTCVSYPWFETRKGLIRREL